jgi:hypothetical protein
MSKSNYYVNLSAKELRKLKNQWLKVNYEPGIHLIICNHFDRLSSKKSNSASENDQYNQVISRSAGIK